MDDGMNQGEVCGPVWLDTMYVAMGSPPVEVEVPVQDPPEQGAATEASVLAVGVQPSTAIGANASGNSPSGPDTVRTRLRTRDGRTRTSSPGRMTPEAMVPR